MLLARQALGVISDDLEAAAVAAPGAVQSGHHHDRLNSAGRAGHLRPVAAGWLTGLDRPRPRWTGSRRLRGQPGAAGTVRARWPRAEVAALLAAELGLHAPRARHIERPITEIAGACAGVTGVLAKTARDVTRLAQSEVGEVAEGGGDGRGGSSAMPQKRNPVAAIAVLGCTRQVPGLVATLVAAAEQEHQRAAGAWHAEWEPLADLLRLTGSAASWAADLLGRLGPIRAGCAATSCVAASRCRARRVAAGARAGACRPRPASTGQRRRRRGAARWVRRCWTSWTRKLTGPKSPREVTAAGPAGYLGAARSSWTQPWPRTDRQLGGLADRKPPPRVVNGPGQRPAGGAGKGRNDGRCRARRAGDDGPP
jgi:3-carboxy-cis,cis-muconate cycloisomerase